MPVSACGEQQVCIPGLPGQYRKGMKEMAEKNIVVVMGGRSSEHEVSLMSAATVIENINTRDHGWHHERRPVEAGGVCG